MVTKQILVNGVRVGEYEATGDVMADLKAASEILDKLGIKAPQQTPGRQIFDSAAQFALAAKYIYDNDLAPKGQPRTSAGAVVPFIVNATFAIELYLKALLVQHGVQPAKVHKLSDLYDVLPQVALDAIGKVIPQCAANRRMAPPKDLRADIVALNGVFVAWRYSYEHEVLGPFNIDPTLLVATALHEAFREVSEKTSS